MARITIDVDLPPEVEITGYQRYQDGHGLEVRWPLPARCRCEKCGHDDVAHIEFKTIPQAIRDLNLWEQPCFWIYQAPFHRCARCNYRQHIIPPFKRKDVSYTYRFEQFVLRSLIGSTAEEVARRLGISGSSVFKCKTSRIGPSGPWPSGGCARSSSRLLATPDSSPGSIGPTDSSLTSVHRYAW